MTLEELAQWGRARGLGELDLTDLSLIVPAGSRFACAVDPAFQVIGLKMAECPPDVGDVLLRLPHLERLCLVGDHGTSLPEFSAPHLRYVYLAGSLSSVPWAVFAPIRVVLPPDELTEPSFRGWPEVTAVQLGAEEIAEAQRLYSEIPAAYEGPRSRGASAETQAVRLLDGRRYEGLQAKLEDLRGLDMGTVTGLEDPPLEILREGAGATHEYFEARKLRERSLNEVKLILIGGGGAGKTSLLRRLTGDDFDPREAPTHGINLELTEFGETLSAPVVARIWDFGGQEIMHATHQFFLSHRSIYLVVLDGRREDGAHYWLNHVRSFGGDSPVIVVLNKHDDVPYEVDEAQLRRDFPAIAAFVKTSCVTGKGLETLRDQIEEVMAVSPMLSTRWPESWFRVKEHLERSKQPVLTRAAYRDLCAAEGVTLEAAQEVLARFLHDLGIVMRFDELSLLDVHVLDPEWLTGAVYTIVTSRLLAERRGVLSDEEVSIVLSGYSPTVYPRERHQYFLNVMQKFELCYALPAGGILVPELLGLEEASFDPGGESVRLVVEYEFLPRSVVPRLIVRLHEDVIEGRSWRNGTILESQIHGSRARILANRDKGRIELEVAGRERREYLSFLRQHIAGLNQTYERITATELVPLPGLDGRFVGYEELVGHERAGREEYFEGTTGRTFSVRRLLSGVDAPSAGAPAVSSSRDSAANNSATIATTAIGSAVVLAAVDSFFTAATLIGGVALTGLLIARPILDGDSGRRRRVQLGSLASLVAIVGLSVDLVWQLVGTLLGGLGVSPSPEAPMPPWLAALAVVALVLLNLLWARGDQSTQPSPVEHPNDAR